ncbi:hypothetical protein KNV44_gp38 [uncultured phage cr127_1]|uniref:Uncharacterized protein n=1 Tax=uncultured phage cr127_1 TaxID=2772077 RepID=A0A7M1RZE1_9CAUD|nr:hypothetical protein KNV44_gp38 [uncultured phage cr127_1]QOR59797.1 hypothetical protein [uncultured phage cr127_1]
MAQKTKSNLKKLFVSQAIPTESDFSDLIDSVQATLVANGNIKLSNRSDGSVAISAEIPEPKPVIPKFINQFITGSTPIYDGDGVPFFIQSVIDRGFGLDSKNDYKNLPDGSIVLLVNSGKTDSQCAINIDGTIYQSSSNDFLCVVLLVVHRNSSGSTQDFVHQVIIGEKLK